MIYPEKNIIIRWVFNIYSQRITARHFHSISFNNLDIDKNKSILLIANHFGWWDGFILYWVNSRLLKKNFHVMLLEETSIKTPILKYAGGFSINKKTRDIVESLDFAAKLLSNPQNMVLIFPQGKYYSNFVTEPEFEKGVMKILKQAAGKFQLIFSATFIENFQHKKPGANVYLKLAPDANFNTIDELQHTYQQHYNAARLQQTQIVI